MRYYEFLSRVQDQAELSSQMETIKLINITLEMMEERKINHFTLDEFYERVNARTNLGYSQTVTGVQVVMRVLKEAFGGGWRDELTW